MRGEFVLDLGASHAVMLRSPVVSRMTLPSRTMQLIGSAGAGGKTVGRIGRVKSVRIGPYILDRPLTVFSEDLTGGNASKETLGSFGAELADRFRIFLDYPHSRVILEPNERYGAPFDHAVTGASIQASGHGFHTFRVVEIAPDSPASRAGLTAGDAIVRIDERNAADLTLTEVITLLEHAGPHRLTILRGEKTMNFVVNGIQL